MRRKSSPSPPRVELIDDALLKTYSMGDKQTELGLLGDFRRTNDVDGEKLRLAVSAADFPQISHFAHRIAGACLMLGVHRVVALCRRMESDSRAGNLRKVSLLQVALENELRQLNGYLDHKVATIASSIARDAG